tara:strand:- start:88 stop:1254 length:1167 start_codon:yes stop_codon:yes gene_type:complete
MLPPGFSIEGFGRPRMTTQAVGEDGGGGMVDPMIEGRSTEDLIATFKELRGGASTLAMGEDGGGGFTDFGPPSGISNFSTMAVGEDGGGGSPMPDFGGMMTMALGEESGGITEYEYGPHGPPSVDALEGPGLFGQPPLGLEGNPFRPGGPLGGPMPGGGGLELPPSPGGPPSQSRTTELIEELISLLRGSRSPPNVLERRPPQVGQVGSRRTDTPMSPDISAEELQARFLRETSNPMQQAAPRPPPSQQAEVSGIGALNSLASNPLFQDFATQLQSSNPRQSALLGNLFEQGSKGLQQSQQNQFQPQNNPFMSNSSPFMAPPQFFAPQASGQFAPPPMGFSQFQPPIPYGSAGGFAPPPPQFAPMQQGTGDSSPFASSIRNVGFAMMQ